MIERGEVRYWVDCGVCGSVLVSDFGFSEKVLFCRSSWVERN